MQHDTVIWSLLDNGACSFRTKTQEKIALCRSPHSVDGLCRRTSCPLANSNYATILEDDDSGELVLHVKTIERAAFPARLWEKTVLARNYQQALSQVQDALRQCVCSVPPLARRARPQCTAGPGPWRFADSSWIASDLGRARLPEPS